MEITYPSVGKGCIDFNCSEITVTEVTEDGLVLNGFALNWTIAEVQSETKTRRIIDADLKEIEL